MKYAEAVALKDRLIEDRTCGYNDGANGRPYDPPPFATSEYKYGYEEGQRERKLNGR